MTRPNASLRRRLQALEAERTTREPILACWRDVLHSGPLQSIRDHTGREWRRADDESEEQCRQRVDDQLLAEFAAMAFPPKVWALFERNEGPHVAWRDDSDGLKIRHIPALFLGIELIGPDPRQPIHHFQTSCYDVVLPRIGKLIDWKRAPLAKRRNYYDAVIVWSRIALEIITLRMQALDSNCRSRGRPLS